MRELGFFGFSATQFVEMKADIYFQTISKFTNVCIELKTDFPY